LAALGSQTFVPKILDDAETPFKPITYSNTISASAKKFENCHPNRLIRKVTVSSPVLGSSHFSVKTASSGSHSHYVELIRFSLLIQEENI
jgi:hypothetical protein